MIFLTFLCDLLLDILLVFAIIDSDTLFLILFKDQFVSPILYYAMNQLSWYVLVTHLKTYNLILSGKKYKEWKAKIKRIEKASFILLIIAYSVYILTIAAYDILIREYEDAEKILQNVLLCEISSFYFLLIITELLIYCQLSKVMKQNLNFHYSKNWKSFVVTVKAFVVTPQMTKNSIIFRGGYNKGYKISMADENLFVCILIYLYVS